MKYFLMDKHGTAPSVDVVHKVVHKLQQPGLHGRDQWYDAVLTPQSLQLADVKADGGNYRTTEIG